jgi:hypothetical protein
MAETPKNPSGGAPIKPPANLDDVVNAPTSKFAQATNEAKPPAGAVMPPKKETGKVQPKKETVRINLPPKPTAAPTIKLPTLPPGGPTGAPTPVRAPGKPDDLVNAPTTKLASATTEAKSPAAPRAATAAPSAGQRPATPAPRSAAAQAAPTVSGLDKILAISAMVAALFAVGTVVYLWKGISIDY